VLEEEMFEKFKTGKYYPVNIGDVLSSGKYQVLGKLGFGSTSTVWLARNMKYVPLLGKLRERASAAGIRVPHCGWEHDFVTLKIFARDHEETCRNEFQTYQAIDDANPLHPGHNYVRPALETFTIDRPGGDHQCLVQTPLWDSWKDLLRRNPAGRFSDALLKGSLQNLLLALDYLHTECKLVHTGEWRVGSTVCIYRRWR
jgi:serine/threonine protein kinase